MIRIRQIAKLRQYPKPIYKSQKASSRLSRQTRIEDAKKSRRIDTKRNTQQVNLEKVLC